MSDALPQADGAGDLSAGDHLAEKTDQLLTALDRMATPPLRAIDIIRRRSAAARREFVIPEWEDMRLWFNKLTVADMEATGDRVNAAGKPMTALERNLVLVIVKAENEDGTPAFALGDLHFLKVEAEFAIVQRLIDFMFDAALPPPEKEADRITADPPSTSV